MKPTSEPVFDENEQTVCESYGKKTHSVTWAEKLGSWLCHKCIVRYLGETSI
jgi:hypothetical protein